MKRPSFQFYPGDWRKNAKLRRCSPAARGVWMDILCLLHDSEEEYGVLRWPLKDIANAAGGSMAHVRELVEKGVFKGADCNAEAYVYRPKHAGKLGEPVVLVMPENGPVWYSSRFVRDEWVRQKRGEVTRFGTANQPASRSPTQRVGDPHGDGPSSSSSPTGSVAKATDGAGAPASGDEQGIGAKPGLSAENVAKAQLWRAAVAVIAAGGCDSEDVARSFMGKLVKDYGIEVVRQAVAAAATSQPVDAREYLKATCQRLKGERKDPVTVADNPDVKATNLRLAAEADRQLDRTPETIAAAKEAAARLRAALLAAPAGAPTTDDQEHADA